MMIALPFKRLFAFILDIICYMLIGFIVGVIGYFIFGSKETVMLISKFVAFLFNYISGLKVQV